MRRAPDPIDDDGRRLDQLPEEPADGPTCPTCGGEALDIGRLGPVRWLRCRACGLDHAAPGSAVPTLDPYGYDSCRNALALGETCRHGRNHAREAMPRTAWDRLPGEGA